MKSLEKILEILSKQTNIQFSIGNDSSAWKGQWIVRINMMDCRGSHYFHSDDVEIATEKALQFLNDYRK